MEYFGILLALLYDLQFIIEWSSFLQAVMSVGLVHVKSRKERHTIFFLYYKTNELNSYNNLLAYL